MDPAPILANDPLIAALADVTGMSVDDVREVVTENVMGAKDYLAVAARTDGLIRTEALHAAAVLYVEFLGSDASNDPLIADGLAQCDVTDRIAIARVMDDAIAQRFVRDPDARVQAAVAQGRSMWLYDHPEVTDALAKDPDPILRAAYSDDVAELRRFARHPDPEVRFALCGNLMLPVDVAEILAHDAPGIRRCLAGALSEKHLELLRDDPDAGVRETLARRLR